MKFWDSSAIIPLMVDEKQSDYCLNALSSDQEMLVWCLTKVEVISALCRRQRERSLRDEDFQRIKRHLNYLLKRAWEIQAIDRVRQRALRLLEVHPLRAADACQLASALVATQEDPGRVAFICFDQNLSIAAVKEGFKINPQ